MYTRSSLNAVAKRRILCPCQEPNPGRPARNIFTVLTEVPFCLLCFHIINGPQYFNYVLIRSESATGSVLVSFCTDSLQRAKLPHLHL